MAEEQAPTTNGSGEAAGDAAAADHLISDREALDTGADLTPDPDEAAALIGPATAAIVLVTPVNPTGVTIGPEVTMATLALST